MDVVGADAVVELDVRFQLHLRHGHVIQAFGRPRYDLVDFVQIDGFQPPVALGYLHVAGHVCVSL